MHKFINLRKLNYKIFIFIWVIFEMYVIILFYPKNRLKKTFLGAAYQMIVREKLNHVIDNFYTSISLHC